MAVDLLGTGWMRMVNWMHLRQPESWTEIRHYDHWEEADPDDFETCPDCGAATERTIILEQPGIPTYFNLFQCEECDFETAFKRRTIIRVRK